MVSKFYSSQSLKTQIEINTIKISTASSFSEYNKKDATFLNLFISVRRSTCFRRFFRPSSGAQNCTYNFRYLSDKYLTLYVQFWAAVDGRKNRLKHVERLTEINKLRKVASFWLYSANIFVIHGSLNVKLYGHVTLYNLSCWDLRWISHSVRWRIMKCQQRCAAFLDIRLNTLGVF